MSNKPAGSKLSAILQQKCPQCRRGKAFTHPFYNLAHLTDMPKYCEVCGHEFEVEPGYFYSAMYISYMMTCGMGIALGLAVYYIFDDPELWVYWSIIISAFVIISPLSLRLSRMLTMHLITPIKFDEKWK
jgi:uncharacterized protein (DUF983 family)